MKCSKCGYITFDSYEFCPRCNTDFSKILKKLSIIPYTINDNNNYLIESEEIENIESNQLDINNFKEQEHNNINKEEQETKESENLEEVLDTKTNEDDEIKLDNIDIDFEVEHNEADSNEEDDGSISLEDINIDDLLETNREE